MFDACAIFKREDAKSMTESVNTGFMDGEILTQSKLNKAREPEKWSLEENTHQMLLITMLSSFLTPIVAGASAVVFFFGIVYYCLQNMDLRNKSVDSMLSKDHSWNFRKMFLAGAVTYIAGLIYSENFTKADGEAWVVHNILIYVLFSIFVLLLLPFELLVGCCIGYNPKSLASDYSQRRRKIRANDPGQWAKKHQASMVVHVPVIRNVRTEVVEVKAQIRATQSPIRTGIYKELTKPVTLTEKPLRASYLGIVNSHSNFQTPQRSEEDSKFFDRDAAMKSQITPENWKKHQELGRARDDQGQYRGRVDPAKVKDRD